MNKFLKKVGKNIFLIKNNAGEGTFDDRRELNPSSPFEPPDPLRDRISQTPMSLCRLLSPAH